MSDSNLIVDFWVDTFSLLPGLPRRFAARNDENTHQRLGCHVIRFAHSSQWQNVAKQRLRVGPAMTS